MSEPTNEFDVALSFAGPQRDYVRSVARTLRDLGIRVFFDEFEEIALWGATLTEEFELIYNRSSKFAVIFISADYVSSRWTRIERRAAFARASSQTDIYLLPVRFDDAELTGLDRGVAYIRASNYKPDELAELIERKLVQNGNVRRRFISGTHRTTARSGVGWRLGSRRRATSPISASTHGDGAWHRAGMPILHVAPTLSLAVLQTVRPEPGVPFPDDLTAIRLDFPELISSVAIPEKALPALWRSSPPDWFRELVDGWVKRGETAMLEVPSSSAPDDSLLLFNMAHPESSKISVAEILDLDLRSF